MGPQFYSLRTAVRMDGTGLHVLAVAEVPAMSLLLEFVKTYGQREEYPDELVDEFIDDLFEVFRAGLEVRRGDEPVPGRWIRVDDPKNGKLGEEFFLFMLAFEPERDTSSWTGPVQMAVDNEAWPDEEAFFSSYAEGLEPWRVVSSNAEEILGEISWDADFNTCIDCWSNDPALRHLEVVLDRGS